ncbi:MAG: ATP-dependent RecD-like DNA helicase [Anaerolineae bacterium]|nr:ATP-dependent RecD-like DNA helicase [Anaerolineae bacterium]MDH7475519.1 ATP-dependent RecD-like DNA helicase [Anaerolineae bacterium]
MHEFLEGTVERITYSHEETGYTVARLAVDGQPDLVTIVGNLLDINVGERLRLEGFWTTHAQYGRQFKVVNYKTVLPATVEGIRRYLGSGLIKGIGPVTARRIVNKFGAGTLDIIEHHPERLLEVLGVGRKRVQMITRAWEEQRRIKEVMLFLQSHQVSTSLAVKIYKQYGDEAIAVVQENPYRLARDVYGIGFLTADKIARDLGLPADSPQRVAAGISYVLSELADEGHVYVPQDTLIAEAAKILAVPPDLVQESLEQLEDEEQVHRETIVYSAPERRGGVKLGEPGVGELGGKQGELREERAVYLLPFYYGEVGVAGCLRALLDADRSRLSFYRSANWEQVFAYLAESSQLQLSSQQQEAVRTALTHKVTVLTGGPGTGKTTTVQTIIRLLEARRRSYALASPTGRAAKRLSEATDRPAQTVHRLLEYSPAEGFKRNENNPLNVDMVIVDEVSMLDLLLTNHLLKAIPVDAHLLLVGDVDQLPSVGAGNVLRDVIDSGQAAVVRLDTIFRQAADSYIVVNAHRINHGQMPLFPKGARDFFLFVKDDPDEAADLLVDIVQNRIPRKFGFRPLDDVQVLSPMYRGAVGVANLNARLQAALNPPGPHKPERRVGGRVFRVGDRVIQLRNNYDLEVFNGDVGRIAAIDLVNQTLTVDMDGRLVQYDWADADQLAHAFAISVHKSQGSEYPVVVMPVMTTHYMMLTRPILYTGVTRARNLVVLVGSKRAIAIAVHNNRVADRHSALDVRLLGKPVPHCINHKMMI